MEQNLTVAGLIDNNDDGLVTTVSTADGFKDGSKQLEHGKAPGKVLGQKPVRIRQQEREQKSRRKLRFRDL